jgi:hypothetical protein
VEFEIIPLALGKIAQRHIPVDWVEQTLNSPDQIVEGYEGRQVAQKVYDVGGKKMLLRAVFEPTESKRVVVTAYLTSQIERYWRKG